MVPASTTSVVGSSIVVTASTAVAASTTLFWLTTGDIRICGSSSTRDADILWLVLDHGCCSTDDGMCALLSWQIRLPQQLMLSLCWMVCLFRFDYFIVITICSFRRSFVIVCVLFTASRDRRLRLLVGSYETSTANLSCYFIKQCWIHYNTCVDAILALRWWQYYVARKIRLL